MSAERKLIGTADGSAADVDPYFNNVSLLLHGDGTNGAQNNTFLDSSTNNFTITRNGNTTQGTFTPFSQAAGYWSNYFSGSGDYLSINTNAYSWWDNDFTIEFWVNTKAVANQSILSSWYSVWFDQGSWGLSMYSTGVIGLANRQSSGSNQGAFITSGSAVINDGAWHHIALTQVTGASKVFRLFVDGILQGVKTETNWTALPAGSAINNGTDFIPNYPNYLTGNVSNIRLVTQVVSAYSTNSVTLGATIFTPPTSPLTAISGTILLTSQSNRFVDNSANNFTISATGNPSAQPLSPFLPTAPYSTAVNGGSGYFDSNGDYLSAGPNAAFSFGTGDFTVEGWVNSADVSNANQRGWLQTSGTAGGLRPNFTTGVMIYFGDPLPGSVTCNVGGTSYGSAAGTVSANTWAHIAVTRNSGTVNVWVNGVSVASGSGNTFNLGGSNLAIGGYYSTSYLLNGYVSSVRIVKGTAVYTSNFTPPTAPLTDIANTSLLCNFTNAGIYDNAMKNDLETVGNAQISTSVKKYGTGSIAFDGSSGNLIPTDKLGTTFGTGDFTIEFWLYLSSASGVQVFYDGRPGINGDYPTIYMTGGVIYYYVNSANRISGASLSAGSWMHIALARSGTSTKLFINGTQSGSTYGDSTNYLGVSGQYPKIGSSYDSSSVINGYIDDLRITKGVARYTANFTPPTAAFPNQ